MRVNEKRAGQLERASGHLDQCPQQPGRQSSSGHDFHRTTTDSEGTDSRRISFYHEAVRCVELLTRALAPLPWLNPNLLTSYVYVDELPNPDKLQFPHL